MMTNPAEKTRRRKWRRKVKYTDEDGTVLANIEGEGDLSVLDGYHRTEHEKKKEKTEKWRRKMRGMS